MKVFISYSHKDEPLARKVTNALEKAGLSVWDPEREIMPGDNWAAKISQALQDSDAMVLLLTPDALLSKSVQRELEYALTKESYSHRLIPVLVNSQKKLTKEDIPWILRHLNMINISEQSQIEEGIEQIAQALKEVA